MDQLTVGKFLNALNMLKEQGMTLSEIAKLPIYIGNDDELNGIHTAWYINAINSNNPNDDYYKEMINEDRCNIKFDGNAILIS